MEFLLAAPPDFHRRLTDEVVIVLGADGRLTGWACASNVKEMQEIATEMAARGFSPRRPTEEEARQYDCDWVYERNERLSVLQRVWWS
jgi:hypothetical protein